MTKLQPFLNVAVSLIAILLLLTACSAHVDSSNIPDIPDKQPSADNTPIAGEDENTPTEEDMEEIKEFAYETEPLPENLEVRHCVDNVLSFTSLAGMNQQIRAIQEISSSDSSYNQYQAANATSVVSYLVPVFDFSDMLPEYELTKITMRPKLMHFYFEYETAEGVEELQVVISRIVEEDPLRDIELTEGKRRDEDGYVQSPRNNTIYFVAESGYMIAIKPAASWIDVYQLSYREIADMLTIRTVTVNPDHVTE
jgi:hypothetical protein